MSYLRLSSMDESLRIHPITSLLRRLLVLLACFVFLWSIVSPFYRYVRVGFGIIEVGSFASLYWSFTEQIIGLSKHYLGAVLEQKWFLDYWFGNFDINYFGFFLLHPAMFVAQVITLTAGIFSFFKLKKTLAAVSVAACLTTLVLMVYQNLLASDTNLALDYYQLGYWLTYPSLVLFIVNFLLTLALTQARVSHSPQIANVS
jgi:hypothetical protein